MNKTKQIDTLIMDDWYQLGHNLCQEFVMIKVFDTKGLTFFQAEN